jgi:hypothetical protein
MASGGLRRGTAAAAMAAGLLAGCSGSGGGAGAPLAGGDGQAKLNAYTEAYNNVVGPFGLKQQLDSYNQALHGSNPLPEAVSLNGGWLNQAREGLQKARAMPGGDLADADQATDRFLPTLDKLLAEEASLNGYYATKAYKDDDMARGRREEPALLADFHEAMAAAAPLDAALTQARDARQRTELARLKRSGPADAYLTELALSQARALTSGVHSEADLHDPAKIAARDRIAKALQQTLADQHAAVAAAKARPDAAQNYPLDAHGRAGDDLNKVLAGWRDLKTGGGAASYNAMVQAFNSAVEDENSAVQITAALHGAR